MKTHKEWYRVDITYKNDPFMTHDFATETSAMKWANHFMKPGKKRGVTVSKLSFGCEHGHYAIKFEKYVFCNEPTHTIKHKKN